jgi:predicted MFS family arabinose efflux permease
LILGSAPAAHGLLRLLSAGLLRLEPGTSAFNPFFNTYFVDRYHMSVERPGDFRGIASVQLMTACMMAFLVPRLPRLACAAVFVAYMTFQYMTAPSLFSLIMSHVRQEEQSGASALNFLITSLAAVASSFAAGTLIDQRGYSQLLAASALLALVAAILTWTLVPVRERSNIVAELSITD